MNKMTMFLFFALFPSVSYASFPTISELCTAGSELFCCRKSTAGAELVNCLPMKHAAPYEKVKMADTPKEKVFSLQDFSEEEKEAALTRYENVFRVFSIDVSGKDSTTRDKNGVEQDDGKKILPDNIKSSLITKETIDIAVKYKAEKAQEAEKAESTQRPFKSELK